MFPGEAPQTFCLGDFRHLLILAHQHIFCSGGKRIKEVGEGMVGRYRICLRIDEEVKRQEYVCGLPFAKHKHFYIFCSAIPACCNFSLIDYTPSTWALPSIPLCAIFDLTAIRHRLG